MKWLQDIQELMEKIETDDEKSGLFELTGKGFFFFFVVVQNGFDMFCNVVQVMLEYTFT